MQGGKLGTKKKGESEGELTREGGKKGERKKDEKGK